MKKFCVLLLCGILLLSLFACNKPAEPDVMPEDFSFAIGWGVYGISYYNSQTGKLVKTKDATDVSKYTAYVKLSDEDLRSVYKHLFVDIDITSYPETYDPFNAPEAETKVTSSPNQTIVLSVTANGKTKNLACESIAMLSSENGYNEEAKAFVAAIDAVVEILTSLPEWLAFPEYEFFYL